MPHKLSIAVLFLAFAAPLSAQQTGSISGTIVDARDGTPLEKVSVRVHDTPLATLTADDGRFQLDNVPAGQRELYVSSVDYILVRSHELQRALSRGQQLSCAGILRIARHGSRCLRKC